LGTLCEDDDDDDGFAGLMMISLGYLLTLMAFDKSNSSGT
jgi:hypothetical protein